jgi:hypothetical protein
MVIAYWMDKADEYVDSTYNDTFMLLPEEWFIRLPESERYILLTLVWKPCEREVGYGFSSYEGELLSWQELPVFIERMNEIFNDKALEISLLTTDTINKMQIFLQRAYDLKKDLWAEF